MANLPNHISSVCTIPFIFFTSESFKDRTSNFLFAHPAIKNPYQIAINEYMLIFSFNDNELQKRFDFLNNADNSKSKIGFFSPELWKSVNNQILDTFVQHAQEKIKETGKNPFPTKENLK
mgnify:FL=1